MVTITDLMSARDHFDTALLFISILDPQYKKLPFRGTKDKHFIARFYDTEHPREDELMKMDREVRSILSWVRKSGATLDTNIVVHCHAGMSRSPAIAWLILIMLGMDPREAFMTLYKSRPQMWPNVVVMRLGAKYLNLDPTFMKLVDTINTEIAMNCHDYLGYGG